MFTDLCSTPYWMWMNLRCVHCACSIVRVSVVSTNVTESSCGHIPFQQRVKSLTQTAFFSPENTDALKHTSATCRYSSWPLTCRPVISFSFLSLNCSVPKPRCLKRSPETVKGSSSGFKWLFLQDRNLTRSQPLCFHCLSLVTVFFSWIFVLVSDFLVIFVKTAELAGMHTRFSSMFRPSYVQKIMIQSK